MKYFLSTAASTSVIFVALASAAKGYVHGVVDHQHSLELRENGTRPPEKQKMIPPLVIDTFQNPIYNDLGFWHGAGENLSVKHAPGFVRLTPTDPDQNFHTQFDTHGCFSLWPYQNQFLHVVFEGTDRFSVSLNEHNTECNPRRSPFPGVTDTVEAARYVMRSASGSSSEDDTEEDADATSRRARQHSFNETQTHNLTRVAAPSEKGELYIPLSHFEIDQTRVVSVSFHGFYTREPLTLRRVEIVPTVPSPTEANDNFRMPGKLPSGRLILRCTRPGSFAFGIDDGQPQFAQEVMRILDRENVPVTFFVVGAGLKDPETNFTQVYREMLERGHQIALHSNTHPK